MQTRNRPTIKLRGGPHGIPRPVVQEVQRQRLQEAIVDEVAESGYRATTVHKVLLRARISRRTFYELYDGLDDCYLAAYGQACDYIEEVVVAACAGVESPTERIETGLRAVLELFAREPALARACVVEVLAAGEQARARRAEAMERLAEQLASVLRRADGDGRAALLRARVLVGGMHELVYDRVTRGDVADLPELVGEVVGSYLLPGAPVEAGDGP